jgi:hypothetical protein
MNKDIVEAVSMTLLCFDLTIKDELVDIDRREIEGRHRQS